MTCNIFDFQAAPKKKTAPKKKAAPKKKSAPKKKAATKKKTVSNDCVIRHPRPSMKNIIFI